MKQTDYFDVKNSYNYSLNLNGFKVTANKKKTQAAPKRYICIDLEMTESSREQRYSIPGTRGEVIQFGAVMLDENYNQISGFSSYVKPVYSVVTPLIEELTGITNDVLENADDFITVLDKFAYWRGEGDITTFCWSTADFNQLWGELESKGKHRYDLFACLKNFVDLQKTFSQILSTGIAVSLESALKLLNLEYNGQVHNAYCDSFNTARIFHKLILSENLSFEFDYLNPTKNQTNQISSKNQKSENYSASISSMISPEILARFGYTSSCQEEDDDNDVYFEDSAKNEYNIDDEINFLNSSKIELENKDEMILLCSKYKIHLNNWLNFAKETSATQEMLVVQ